MHGARIPIWFFIGLLLAVYGGMIFGYGCYECDHRQLPARGAVDEPAHAGVVGGVLLLLGLVYVVKFRPGRSS